MGSSETLFDYPSDQLSWEETNPTSWDLVNDDRIPDLEVSDDPGAVDEYYRTRQNTILSSELSAASSTTEGSEDA